MDVRQALEQLEDTVISALHLPFSRMAVLDEEGLLDKLDELRLSLPQVIAESEAIVKRRDEIVAQAHRYAEEIVQAAEYKREQLLLESGIVHEAQQQAEEIRGIAQQERQDLLQNTMDEANRVKQDMENYAASVLEELEDRLTQSLHVIHESRNHNYNQEHNYNHDRNHNHTHSHDRNHDRNHNHQQTH